MKTCKKCLVTKDFTLFPAASRMKGGRENQCTACKVAYNKARFSSLVIVPTDTKRCVNCNQTLAASAFYKSSYYKDGLDCRCRSCGDSKTYAWRAKNPEKYNKSHSDYMATISPYQKYLAEIKRRYGCTQETYESMLKEQGNKCAMSACDYVHNPAKIKGGLCVDHCHVTKKIRALLCESCNKALGFFKDDIDRVVAAAEYLIKHETKKKSA